MPARLFLPCDLRCGLFAPVTGSVIGLRQGFSSVGRAFNTGNKERIGYPPTRPGFVISSDSSTPRRTGTKTTFVAILERGVEVQKGVCKKGDVKEAGPDDRQFHLLPQTGAAPREPARRRGRGESAHPDAQGRGRRRSCQLLDPPWLGPAPCR